jgi:hypothetical protein
LIDKNKKFYRNQNVDEEGDENIPDDSDEDVAI